MNANTPVQALVNAEAGLVNAIGQTVQEVRKVGTSVLPSALAELHNAVEDAKQRIQCAAMLYRATLIDLTMEVDSFAEAILADLGSLTVEESTPAPLSVQTEEPVTTLLMPATVEASPFPVMAEEPVITSTEQEPTTVQDDTVEEVVTATAANGPVPTSTSKARKGSRRAQDELEAWKASQEPTGKGRAQRGKRGASKGKGGSR